LMKVCGTKGERSLFPSRKENIIREVVLKSSQQVIFDLQHVNYIAKLASFPQLCTALEKRVKDKILEDKIVIDEAGLASSWSG